MQVVYATVCLCVISSSLAQPEWLSGFMDQADEFLKGAADGVMNKVAELDRPGGVSQSLDSVQQQLSPYLEQIQQSATKLAEAKPEDVAKELQNVADRMQQTAEQVKNTVQQHPEYENLSRTLERQYQTLSDLSQTAGKQLDAIDSQQLQGKGTEAFEQVNLMFQKLAKEASKTVPEYYDKARDTVSGVAYKGAATVGGSALALALSVLLAVLVQ